MSGPKVADWQDVGVEAVIAVELGRLSSNFEDGFVKTVSGDSPPPIVV